MSSTIVTHIGGTEYTRASTVLPSSSLCAASRFFETLNSLSSRIIVRMVSLVTPGRIVPSRGGVTSSSSPSSFFQNTKKFMVPTSVT